MAALVLAIPEIESWTGRRVVVIGGLAVLCRLGRPYRVTSDLDGVDRRATNQPSQLQLLIDEGAIASGAGALVSTLLGSVQVDLLEVTDADLARLPDDPTDRLHVLAHGWAADTATKMVIRADGNAEVTVAVAEPGPLAAMKLQSIMNRNAAKEASDLLDVVNLCLDPETAQAVLVQLASAHTQLRADAAMHAARWFEQRANESLAAVRTVPAGRDILIDDLRLVGELLIGALTG